MNRFITALSFFCVATALPGPSSADAQTTEVRVQIEIVDQADAPVVDEAEVQATEVQEVEVVAQPQPFEQSQTQPAPPQPPLVYAQPAPQPAYGLQTQRDIALRQQLREQRLGGAITMMAAGVVVGTSFAYGAYLAYNVSDVFSEPNVRATAILGGISALGFGLAVIGTVTLIRRLRARSRIRSEFNARYASGDGPQLALDDGALLRW